MIQRNHKIRLEDIETEAINEMLMSLEEPFKGAEIGDWINSGGQAAVHHLNTKTSSEKYVIKVLTNKKGYEKAVRFNEDFVDICEQRQKNDNEDISKSILKVERSFITNTDDDILYCMIEKYHFCLKEYDGPESNKTKDDIEIATRIGADLLPVLSAIEGKSFHRDIKPGNIFFKQRTLSDGFCIGDFGIVTNVNTKGTPTTKNIRGTHETASPDIVLRKDYPQFRNSNKGDMYSLAVTMYYYLNSREYPFIDVYDDDDELDYDIWEELRKKGCEPPKHGSQKLKEIVCKAVEFYPDDRFASCAEMLEELKKTEEYRYFISEPIGEDKTGEFGEKPAKAEEEVKLVSDSRADEAPVNALRLEEYESDEVSVRLSKVQIPSGVTDYRGEMFDGRYRILEAIGLGDMHVVYRAYDTETKNIVAAKILRNEIFRYDTIIEKYQKKIKQAYQKSYMASRHENIAQILGYGTNDSESYVIMEYVDGITLRESIENYQKVNALYTCGISLQILRALHHIHSNEYFHGNICPENIMLCSNGNVMLIGFDSVYGSDSDYRSSTQKYGAEADVDSDIYALGVVMYEMLTGCRPFDSENPLAASLVQGLHAEIKHPMEINSEVPKELDKIIMKALKINQVDGYRSASEMIMELDEFYHRFKEANNKHEQAERSAAEAEDAQAKAEEQKKAEEERVAREISMLLLKEETSPSPRPTPPRSVSTTISKPKKKKNEKLILGLQITGLIILVSAVVFALMAVITKATFASGQAGYGVDYKLYGSSELVISGSGEIEPLSDSMSDFSVFATCSARIGEGITSLGNESFQGMEWITEISLPDSLTNIGDYAFEDCRSLESIFIPQNVESIGTHAFSGCKDLEAITVDENNEYFSSDEYGVLFNKDKTQLIRYPSGSKAESYDIPDSVTSICSNAFEDCKKLESIVICGSVTDISEGAFSSCNRLTEIYYDGTEEQWNSLQVSDDILINAVKYYADYGEDNVLSTETTVSESIDTSVVDLLNDIDSIIDEAVAEETTQETNESALLVGYTSVDFETDGTKRYYFSPPESGYYVFKSDNEEDLKVTLDVYGGLVCEDDDSGADLNFLVVTYLDRDSSVYLDVSSVSGTYISKINVEIYEVTETYSVGVDLFHLYKDNGLYMTSDDATYLNSPDYSSEDMWWTNSKLYYPKEFTIYGETLWLSFSANNDEMGDHILWYPIELDGTYLDCYKMFLDFESNGIYIDTEQSLYNYNPSYSEDTSSWNEAGHKYPYSFVVKDNELWLAFNTNNKTEGEITAWYPVEIT